MDASRTATRDGLQVKKVDGKYNRADLGTKPLAPLDFLRAVQMSGIRDLSHERELDTPAIHAVLADTAHTDQGLLALLASAFCQAASAANGHTSDGLSGRASRGTEPPRDCVQRHQ